MGKKLIDERQVFDPSFLGGARYPRKLPNKAQKHTLILFTAGCGARPIGGVCKSKSTPYLQHLQPVQPRVLLPRSRRLP